jgi:NitT/TauT family transport system substrate-binding protein
MAGRRALLGASALLAFPWPVRAKADDSRGRGGGPVRVGSLHFGTVAWVLDVAREHGLAEEEGVRIEAVDLAGTAAGQVALQGGRVDMIVSDWLLVARRRAEGADLTFAPFSTALGALVVPEGSGIRGLPDLRGRRLGVAGSPLDKSWLLLRLLGLRRHGFDPEAVARPAYGAPPLLAEQLAAGRLDAALVFWPFVARLEARGMRSLLPMQEVLRDLGFAEPLPMVGWTFSESWASANPAALAGFARAMHRAVGILGESDAEWRRIAPLTGAADEAELIRLREHFRAGIPSRWGAAEQAATGRLHAMLADIGGERLVGSAARLPPGTFHATWPGLPG